MPLKKSEIETYKQRLLELKDQLTNNVRTISEDVKSNEDSKGYSQHQADEGTDDSVQNVNIEISSRESVVLRQVDRALEKIEEGTYGCCDLTEQEIPVKRLDAVPYATMTVDAQDRLEKGLL